MVSRVCGMAIQKPLKLVWKYVTRYFHLKLTTSRAIAKGALAMLTRIIFQVMNGRHFSGMVVEAYIADRNEKFKKSSEKKTAMDEDEGEEEGKRLDQFGSWLEEDGGGNAGE